MKRIVRVCVLTSMAALLLLVGCSSSATETTLDQESSGTPTRDTSSAEQDFEAYYEDLAKVYNLDEVPDVDVIRRVSMAERASVLDQCVSAAGFTKVGGMWEYPIEQAPAFGRASITCQKQYPLEEKYLTPYTDAQYRVYHAYYRDTLIPCIESLGYQTVDLPSEDAFVAAAKDGNWWDPMALIPLGLSADRLAELDETCSLEPPEELLYGS